MNLVLAEIKIVCESDVLMYVSVGGLALETSTLSSLGLLSLQY
jgi:hypothetical protein